jgi:DNA-binding transcriptional ArsR family regulator
MVVRNAVADWHPTEQETDLLFRALADPIRRDIVRRSLSKGHSVSELAGRYSVSFAAVQKHVAVLERARLVTKQRHGRERLVRTDPTAIRTAAALLEELESLWRDRIDRFGQVLADTRPDSPS